MTIFQAALLVVIVESSTEVLESASKVSECTEESNLSEPLAGLGTTSRNLLPRTHAVRLAREAGGDGQHFMSSGRPVSRAGGHRLANGLCAPLKC